MTITRDGYHFMLYPPPHWQETAKATRENLAAMRKARDERLANEPHHMHRTIHEQHNQAESDMMVGYLRAVKFHLEFLEKMPEYRDFKWSQSDPPGSPHKERIAPWHKMSKAKMREHHLATRRQTQIYNGKKLMFWKDRTE
jgi:hypothetical protein